MAAPSVSPGKFATFGDLLKYLRKREELTQREFALRVGYSDTQVSRLEHNQRVPDAATLTALFVPALHLAHEPQWVERLLELARQARLAELPALAAAVSPNNLPAFLTTFIGREKEQAAIRQLITAQRLVTLTGSGGVGKTRIALKVGGQLVEACAHGVWLVELAPLSDPARLAPAVASVFGLVAQSSLSHTEVLINFLRPKSALLILDNCEHLLDASAALADRLLKFCPQLKILATSREALGILGERVYPMPSLGLPDTQAALDRFREYESVRLFEERAQLAQPQFQLTEANAFSVAQICTRLDGIPLAIELAAARITMMSPSQIAARLGDSFNLLSGGSRTALPRQQTIRASIDWSWNLISDAERMLLQRLTVFAGGWTLEAAEAVCRTQSGSPSQPVLELMTQLVDKSLVAAERQPGRAPRFHLHETIRQYAHEKLIVAGEQESIRRQHLRYFLELCELAEAALHGPQQTEWYNRLTVERDNLRAALEYASTADMEGGMSLSARLLDYWIAFDLREGLRWSTAFVENAASRAYPQARAKTLITQGYMLWHMQQVEAVRSIAEECLAVFRGWGDRQGEYDALILLGNVEQLAAGREVRAAFHHQALRLAQSMGDRLRQAFALSMLGRHERDPQRSREQLAASVVLFRQVGDWRFLAQTLGILGFTILLDGDLEAAQTILDEAYEVNQQSNYSAMNYVWTGKAILGMLRGDYGQARALLQTNLDELEKTGNHMGYLWGRARLGQVALREGRVAEAQQLLVETIHTFHAHHNQSGLAFGLDKMASLYIVTGKAELAARLIGWSDASRRQLADPRPHIEQDDVDRDIAAIKATIGAEAYEIAYRTGQDLPLDEAVALATDEKRQA